MLRRVFALLLSALLGLGGGAAAAWPALAVQQSAASEPALVAMAVADSASEAEPSAFTAAQGLTAAFDLNGMLQSDEGAAGTGTGDDWSAPTAAEWLFDVSALPPVAPHSFANGLRGAPPPRLALVRYQPPDLEGPQRPPRALIG